VLTDELASRQHARVSWQNGEWILEDLGSQNGTFANDQQIQPPTRYPLFSGDQVRLARTVLGFEEIYDDQERLRDEYSDHQQPPEPEDGSLHPLTFTMIGIAAVLLLVLLVLAILVLIQLM
jgi:pSer/pThr/pTyr-binding forkhead associated (FHA) protein